MAEKKPSGRVFKSWLRPSARFLVGFLNLAENPSYAPVGAQAQAKSILYTLDRSSSARLPSKDRNGCYTRNHFDYSV